MANNLKTSIGLKIKELRKKKNLSAKEFGAKIGISYVSIYRIENGETMASEKTQTAIINEFNLPKNYFLLAKGSEQIEELKKENSFLKRELERYRKMIDAMDFKLGNFFHRTNNTINKVFGEVTPLQAVFSNNL